MRARPMMRRGPVPSWSIVSDKPKHSVRPKPEPRAPEPSGSGRSAPALHFADGAVETSWFRRAIAAGLRFTRARSERSGSKLIAVLDLEVDEKDDFSPKLAKNASAPSRGHAGGFTGRPQKYARAKPPPAKHAFGETAINEFLASEEQRRPSATVRVRRIPSPMMASHDAVDHGPLIKKMLLVALVFLIGIGVWRIFASKELDGAAARIKSHGDSVLRETETSIEAPKSKARKRANVLSNE